MGPYGNYGFALAGLIVVSTTMAGAVLSTFSMLDSVPFLLALKSLFRIRDTHLSNEILAERLVGKLEGIGRKMLLVILIASGISAACALAGYLLEESFFIGLSLALFFPLPTLLLSFMVLTNFKNRVKNNDYADSQFD